MLSDSDGWNQRKCRFRGTQEQTNFSVRLLAEVIKLKECIDVLRIKCGAYFK